MPGLACCASALLLGHFLTRDAPIAIEPGHDFACAGMIECPIAFLQPLRTFDPQILEKHQIAAHKAAKFRAENGSAARAKARPYS